MHGGTTPTGKDAPNFVHGLRSKYLDPEDEEIYDGVAETEVPEIVLEEIHFLKTKLLRASRETGGNDATRIVDKIVEQLGEDQEIDDDLVASLANLMQTSERAVNDTIDRMNKLAKTHHKLTEGDSISVEHSGKIDGERSHSIEADVVRDALKARRKRAAEDAEFEEIDDGEGEGATS